MTELQIAIGHLKEAISVGNVLLAKMEAEQKDLDKPKVPSFPSRFIVVRDINVSDLFVIGLAADNLQHWGELPSNFKGRALFDKEEIQQIITGLQTLLGDSDA